MQISTVYITLYCLVFDSARIQILFWDKKHKLCVCVCVRAHKLFVSMSSLSLVSSRDYCESPCADLFHDFRLSKGNPPPPPETDFRTSDFIFEVPLYPFRRPESVSKFILFGNGKEDYKDRYAHLHVMLCPTCTLSYQSSNYFWPHLASQQLLKHLSAATVTATVSLVEIVGSM